MILPVRYMWEQLNGPQVSALSDALFEYWKSIFDTKLDYFNNISVQTANDPHLTLLGLLAGLIRPTIAEPSAEFFYFTERPEQHFFHGFSDLDNPEEGGRFSKLDGAATMHNASLNEEYYRALLKAWISGEGDIGSLALLDDMCYELAKLDIGYDVTPYYRFVFMEGDDIPVDRAPGDVYIDMGQASDWANPIQIYAVIQGIGNSAYAPQPRLFVSIGLSGRVSTPSVSLESGEYTGPQECEITVAIPPTATIYYTLDGSEPTEESTVYTGPLTISESCVLSVIAAADNYGVSNLVRKSYVIN